MKKYIPIYLLILLGVATRFVPHPANFTAISAVALFGGLYLPRKQAIIIPLLAMFISDIFIGFYNFQIMLSVYIGFVLMVFIGQYLQNRIKILPVIGGTLVGSIIFFLLTNMAVWMFGTMYAHNIFGLMTSYYMGLPFLRNMILGDMLYVAILVGGYETTKQMIKKYAIENA
jgi:hypothetical protein